MFKRKSRCPCGGIILADTEDCTTPLCCNCSEEIVIAFGVNKALLAQALQLAEALNDIAAWYDGDDVDSSFDEPGSATKARDALSVWNEFKK